MQIQGVILTVFQHDMAGNTGVLISVSAQCDGGVTSFSLTTTTPRLSHEGTRRDPRITLIQLDVNSCPCFSSKPDAVKCNLHQIYVSECSQFSNPSSC